MTRSVEDYGQFYTQENLGFDITLVKYCYESFKPYFNGLSCLELGPANGFMTQYLKDDFQVLDLVEGSKSLLEQIPGYPGIRKFHSLFADFKPDRLYDTIIMNHVLEHIEQPVELLAQIRNWLAPSGVFICGVPNSQSFHRLAAVHMGLLATPDELNERDVALGHYRVYSPELLQQHATAAGFQVTDSGGVFLKFLSNKQTESLLSEEIINAYYQLGKQFKNNCAEIFLVLKK